MYGHVSLRCEAEEEESMFTLFFVSYCEAFKNGVWFQNFIVTSKFCFTRRFFCVAINVKSNISISEFLQSV